MAGSLHYPLHFYSVGKGTFHIDTTLNNTKYKAIIEDFTKQQYPKKTLTHHAIMEEVIGAILNNKYSNYWENGRVRIIIELGADGFIDMVLEPEVSTVVNTEKAETLINAVEEPKTLINTVEEKDKPDSTQAVKPTLLYEVKFNEVTENTFHVEIFGGDDCAAVVTAVCYGDEYYTATIQNYQAIQHPVAVLDDEECAKFLKENINDAGYKMNHMTRSAGVYQTDFMEIYLPIFDTKSTISLTLEKDYRCISTYLHRRINTLEAQVKRLVNALEKRNI